MQGVFISKTTQEVKNALFFYMLEDMMAASSVYVDNTSKKPTISKKVFRSIARLSSSTPAAVPPLVATRGVHKKY
jgi:hypothetical protein